MTGKSLRFILLACALVLAACGTIATPVWETEEADTVAEPTEVAVEPTAVETVEVEPTATPLPPTETPAPTATPLPPTSTPEPTATPLPPTVTPEPTEEPEVTAGDEADTATVEGDPAAGEQLFTAGAGGGIPCSTCHYTNSADPLVGPGLAGIAQRAEERVPDQSAVEYLHTSIVEPDAYVVDGFPAGVMPQNYGDVYSEEQINDLVAYLMSLE